MSERWLPIPGWEGYYEVSDLGRVKSCARSVPGRPGRMINRRERILTPMVSRDGYLCVALCRDNVRHHTRVHRAVLLAFVGPCPDGMEGCHGDGDSRNNALTNLRWDTRSANTYDKVAHGTHPQSSKTHCPQGHAYDEANTYWVPSRGGRHCRECTRTNKRLRRERAA